MVEKSLGLQASEALIGALFDPKLHGQYPWDICETGLSHFSKDIKRTSVEAGILAGWHGTFSMCEKAEIAAGLEFSPVTTYNIAEAGYRSVRLDNSEKRYNAIFFNPDRNNASYDSLLRGQEQYSLKMLFFKSDFSPNGIECVFYPVIIEGDGTLYVLVRRYNPSKKTEYKKSPYNMQALTIESDGGDSSAQSLARILGNIQKYIVGKVDAS